MAIKFGTVGGIQSGGSWEDEPIESQIAMADALRKQALEGTGRMIGPVYVRKSPWLNLAQGLAGGALRGYGEQQRAQLGQSRQEQLMEALRGRPSATMTEQVPGKPAVMQDIPGGTGGFGDAGPTPAINEIAPGQFGDASPKPAINEIGPDVRAPQTVEVSPAVAPTTRQVVKPVSQYARETEDWAGRMAAINHPLAQSMAAYGMQQALQAPEKAAEREDAARIRKDAAEQAIKDKIALVQEQHRLGQISKAEADARHAALLIQLKEMTNENALALKRMGLDSRNAAADEKAKTKEQERQEAKDSALRITDNIAENIDKLEKGGGVVKKGGGVLTNTRAYLANLPLGQEVQRMYGGMNQAERDMLESRRMQLLTELKKAKGLSASEMNSNFELQKRLEALGGGRMEVGALKEILDDTRELFGGARKYGVKVPGRSTSGTIGPAAPAAAPASPAGAPPAGWTAAEWAALTPEERASLGK